MPKLLKIELHNLLFFAFHGLYAEEKKAGNEYKVDLTISYVPTQLVIENIQDTINYVTLYDLVKASMAKPSHLLETVAMEIAHNIHHEFPQVKKIEIAVNKLHPPIIHFQGNVGVRYETEF